MSTAEDLSESQFNDPFLGAVQRRFCHVLKEAKGQALATIERDIREHVAEIVLSIAREATVMPGPDHIIATLKIPNA